MENICTLENPNYLSEQLITYIGNKRSLLAFIESGLKLVQEKLKKEKLKTFDVFSGSGVVSRFFKKYSSTLITNDLEKYSYITNKCYLTNKSEINLKLLNEIYNDLKEKLDRYPLHTGFIADLYSPKDDNNIKNYERVFYTRRNAMYLDTARKYIEDVEDDLKYFLLAPLLSEASIHANTSGVFKGFYKDSESGIGKFGGNNQDALFRIKGNIDLPFPVFSNFNCEVKIYNDDSNKIIDSLEEVDIAYLDPPYNQHPYGSNYFMLNLLTDYKEPTSISDVSGIPTDWKRSNYNKKPHACNSLKILVENIKAKFLLISFNSDGYIKQDAMLFMLSQIGKVTTLETKYNTFRGSRNLSGRDIHIKEYLYLVEK